MTLSEIRGYVTNFTTDFQLDNFLAASPTAAQLTGLVNWAIRLFSRKTLCNFDPEMTLTLVAGTQVYNIRDVTTPVVSRKVIHPLFVTINTVPLMGPDGRTPGMWGFSQLADFRWTFQTEANGKPFRAAVLPGYKIALSPPPDAGAVSDGNNFIAGYYMAANMVNSTDDANSPDIPEEYHEILAYLVAFKAAQPRAGDEAAWGQLRAYDSMAFKEIQALAAENAATALGASGNRGYANQWLQEVVW